MDTATVFMFPGQGAQYYQMGKELYQHNSRFRLWMDFCDELTFDQLGCSLIEIIHQEKATVPFDRLKYSNPALLSIEFSLARVLMEWGIQPDFMLGYSLGEITASVLAGAIPIEIALSFSIELAEILESKSPDARMLSIHAEESLVHEEPGLFHECWPIAHNLTNHFVVSGLTQNITQLSETLKARNIICQVLPVNYGFHSEIIEPLKEDIMTLARRINFMQPKIPFVSSVYASQIESIDETFIWDLLRKPVHFREAVTVLDQKFQATFIDVGPTGTLANFVKYSPVRSRALSVMNQFGKDIDTLERVRSELLEDALA